MADFAKIDQARDLAQRARALKGIMDAATATGSVDVGSNPDAAIPYTIGLQTLYTTRLNALVQQAKDAFAAA